MKTIYTILILLYSYLSFAQNYSDKNISTFSTEIYSYHSSNYIKELAKDMDTTFLSRYEDEIIKFEKEDSAKGIKKGQVLFAGSSSFRKWLNMKKDLFPIPVLNRGFGGSTMPELDYYFFRIVKPYNPSAIVIYEGDNDVLAPFLTPELILKSFDIFVQLTKQYLPNTKIFFVSIKPSPARAAYLKKMNKTNRLIRNYCEKDKYLFYIDITKQMFCKNGQIRQDIFRKDLLHMNEKGYNIWRKIIKKELINNL